MKKVLLVLCVILCTFSFTGCAEDIQVLPSPEEEKETSVYELIASDEYMLKGHTSYGQLDGKELKTTLYIRKNDRTEWELIEFGDEVIFQQRFDGSGNPIFDC